MAEHDLLHVVEFVGARSRVAHDGLGERRLEIATAGLGHEQHARDRMVDEAGADAGKIDERLDAEIEQRSFGPDARAEKDCGGADRACGEGYALTRGAHARRRLDFDADRALLPQEDAVDWQCGLIVRLSRCLAGSR